MSVIFSRRLIFRGAAALAYVWSALPAAAQLDALPSWHNTEVKGAIIRFVDSVTRERNFTFVPVADRIAVFDMDGTLIPEQPIPSAVLPLLDGLKRAVSRDPTLTRKPAIAAFLKGDLQALHAAGEKGIADIVAAVTAGRTAEEVGTDMRKLMSETKHQKFERPMTAVKYQPMIELIDYLKANNFQVWICSGSPILFTRQFSQDMFGIPPERVMGTNIETKLDNRGGKTVLVFGSRIDHINDKDGKPVTINLAIGKRPVFVGGNVRSFGDIAMMRYSKDRSGPSFQLLINHDDAEREYAYAEPDNASLNAAAKFGFHVVSMKNDWRTILPEQPGDLNSLGASSPPEKFR